MRLSAYALESFGDVRLHEVMARDLVSVTRDMPLQQVAQTMVSQGIHRVLVLDPDCRLLGIITATDFVRVFAEQA